MEISESMVMSTTSDDPGLQVHGRGDFGLDALRAFPELDPYQLGESGLWILKLVQAAVAARASRVDVKFGRRRMKVRFQPASVWSADEILRDVMSGQPPAERALSHLVAGLRACAGHLTEIVSWSCGQARVTLKKDRGLIEAQPQSSVFELEATRPARALSLSRLLYLNFTQLIRQTAEEHEALLQRCWTCPIPIFIDGRPLARGYDEVVRTSVDFKPWQVQRASDVYGCLGLGYLTDASAARPELPPISQGEGSDTQITSPFYAYETFLRSPSPSVSHGAIAIHVAPFVVASIQLVLDGVVVESRPLLERLRPKSGKFLGMEKSSHTFLRPRVILPIEPQEADPSHFQVDDFQVEERFNRTVPGLVELLESIVAHKDRLSYMGVNGVPVRRSGRLLAAPISVVGVPLLRRQLLDGVDELLQAIRDSGRSS